MSNRKSETIRRVARLLGIITDIADCHQRRRALANRYEVSERMITKDLEIIRYGVGLPLAHGPDGYYFERPPRIPRP
jgi:predicted DNA-binding transcriptional regulator YafY